MRVTVNSYVLGAIPRLRATFTDSDGAVMDPSVVLFKIIEPDDEATVTEYEYGTDAELVREEAGIYYVEWTTRVAGDHCYRFDGTGNVRAASERHFTVAPGCFA